MANRMVDKSFSTRPSCAKVLRIGGRRRLVLLFLAGKLLIPTAHAGAQSNATSVSSPKDEVITITVNIDAPGLTDEEAKQWKKDAETVWNAGFDRWPAQCFKLHLVVNVTPQPSIPIENARPRPGHHLIIRGAFNKGYGSLYSGVKSYEGDTTYPLENTTWGAWGPDVDLHEQNGRAAYAHEVGHLMGLGDDYQNIPATSQHPRQTPPKPGRKNTLMADGGPVDKQLVDRLAELLRQVGKLPPCGGYSVLIEGSMHTHVKYPDTSRQGDNQPYEADVKLTWRTVYPEVGVAIMQYYPGTFQIFLKDRWHAEGRVTSSNAAADPQGTIDITLEAREPYCDVMTNFTVPAYIDLGGSESAPGKFNFSFRSSDFEYEAGTPFKEHIASAIQAGCRPHPRDAQGNLVGPFDGFPVVEFPLKIGPEQFTTDDGLIWQRPHVYGSIQVDISRNGGPPGFPVNLLKDGKSFTLSTGQRVLDEPLDPTCRERCQNAHAEGIITIKFTHRDPLVADVLEHFAARRRALQSVLLRGSNFRLSQR